MYLKTIEIQGFKSFANKIRFEFKQGITGIVGPNGSGKSNVADAVRWVLGEQSAKSLRGSSMGDVIFAGTQLRKPVSFSSVSITFDNSDHILPIEYDEVTVTRKLFRSGESEYQINGHTCRLKDVNELFYDTGIGQEGYSIIGQGQIERILSGKPEERRELFDEAAGIVKYKRRKAEAVRKLNHEQDNLTRVNDILEELEKQVGPLEIQSGKAKQYLDIRERLKTLDANAFLLQMDKIEEDTADADEKLTIATKDYEAANADYENTKQEYEAVEEDLNELNSEIDEKNQNRSESEVTLSKLQGQVNLYEEQINTIKANAEHVKERLTQIVADREKRLSQKENYQKQQEELNNSLSEYNEKKEGFERKQEELREEICVLTDEAEKDRQTVLRNLERIADSRSEEQSSKTLKEQIQIRRSRLNSTIIQGKSREQAQLAVIEGFREALAKAETALNDAVSAQMADQAAYEENRNKLHELTNEIDREQQRYHREKSKMESLVAITERYDGYGNSIKRIMDLKNQNPGILGVVADIVKVEKKYETAVETALGGTIQNIVTDNEKTAKNLIQFLKQNHAGRATFLPLKALTVRNTLDGDECTKEPGVVGVASKLVHVSFEYKKLASYLLGRTLVVDTIDNALAIARKYRYTLRIVTLEGEQLNPGGSMTGGAFKNAGNLLGRRREIEDLKKSIKEISELINAKKEEQQSIRATQTELREKIQAEAEVISQAKIDRKSAELQVKQATDKKNEIVTSYGDSSDEIESLEEQLREIESTLKSQTGSVTALQDENAALNEEIDSKSEQIAEKEKELHKAETAENELKVSFSSSLQKEGFLKENIERINGELEALKIEEEGLSGRADSVQDETREKQSQIEEVKQTIEACEASIAEIKAEADALRERRDEKKATHKEFFDRREALQKQIADLDKEIFRLKSRKEKLDEQLTSITDYMWQEYELTYSYAEKLRDATMDNLSALKKDIAKAKSDIKELGDVNVNAIEEFKAVNERYQFLKAQHDDLIKAAEQLTQIITDLDEGMRKQFNEKFAEIKAEFNKVFGQLFGGGKGEIELEEGADVLEAGISIISQPPGKKLQNMMMLSGGEKALTAIALLFAIQNLKPSPFCLLDEIEAALDDSNVARYAEYLHKLTEHTQFIVITHRRGTMNAADRLYGITMQEKGVSTLVSVDLIASDIDRENAEAEKKLRNEG